MKKNTYKIIKLFICMLVTISLISCSSSGDNDQLAKDEPKDTAVTTSKVE